VEEGLLEFFEGGEFAQKDSLKRLCGFLSSLQLCGNASLHVDGRDCDPKV
jgi:hypothetical protein